MPKLDTEKQTITATGKELLLFLWWSIVTIMTFAAGSGLSIKHDNPVLFIAAIGLLIILYRQLPSYRWALHQLFCGIAASGTYMGQSMIGCMMDFELPGGAKAKGKIVRCSLALDWRVVKTWDNKFYLVFMPIDQPIGHRRWSAIKDVTEEWSAQATS